MLWGPIDLYHDFLLVKLISFLKRDVLFFHFTYSLLKERTCSAFIPCTKTMYFLARPQTPFASKCFPDAFYLQRTHQHLGTGCPKDPEKQKQTCRQEGRWLVNSASPVLSAVNASCVLGGCRDDRTTVPVPQGFTVQQGKH